MRVCIWTPVFIRREARSPDDERKRKMKMTTKQRPNNVQNRKIENGNTTRERIDGQTNIGSKM